MISNCWRMLACGSLALVLCVIGARAEQPLCDSWRAAPRPAGSVENDVGSKPAASAPAAASQPQISGAASIADVISEDDPLRLFLSVVDRYRRLHTYRDTVNLVQVTHRAGEEPTRVETKLTCEVTGRELRVTTPASQMRSAVGLNMPTQKSADTKQREQDYALWLAPHMKMKFSDKPLEDFRAGVEEGFTATEAESVTIDEKSMVHLELRSGDGQSESCAAEFDLYIDSQSLLIERIEGRQRLPDGAELETTLEITPDESGISDLPQQVEPTA